MQPSERAVVLRECAIDRVACPGRTRWPALATQDVLSADGRQVRITPVVRFRVSNVRAWLAEAGSPADAVYVLAPLAVRDAVTARTLDEVLASRADVLACVRESLAPAVSALGAEVLEAHPSLLQLRTLEAAAASGQFIVRVGDPPPGG